MSSLCLTGDGLTASLFAAALHFGWTPADGVAREESWHIYQKQFEFFAARKPQQRLVFDRRGLRADYVICGEMWCMPLERLMPRSRAPVVQIAPCE